LPRAGAWRKLYVMHRSLAFRRLSRGLIPAATALLLAPALAGAQQLRPSATGATVALSGRGALVSTNVDGPSRWSRAAGVAAEVGYGVNPRLTLFGAMASLRLDSDPAQRFRDADVGFRRLLGRGGNAVRPFLEGGITVQRMTVEVPAGAGVTQVRSTTGSLTGGVGAMWFVRRQLALDGALRGTGGRFSSWADASGASRPVLPVQVRSVALRVGARYWLSGR
jgi:hypothetical protein